MKKNAQGALNFIEKIITQLPALHRKQKATEGTTKQNKRPNVQ